MTYCFFSHPDGHQRRSQVAGSGRPCSFPHRGFVVSEVHSLTAPLWPVSSSGGNSEVIGYLAPSQLHAEEWLPSLKITDPVPRAE